MKNIIFPLIAFVLVISSCRKDIDVEETTIFIPASENVITNLHGRIVSPSGFSIPEAQITVVDRTVITNGDGYFYIPEISVPGDGFAINVRDLENNKVIRRAVPQAETNTYEEIILAPSLEFTTYSSTNESIVSNGPTTVTIRPNSLVNSGGNIYQGNYLARLLHYYPSAANNDILRTMPGNLQGIDKEGNKVTLGTYGMIDIEVIDSIGEPLDLAMDMKANVKMLFPALSTQNLPSAIPTWKLDETSGLWLEDGETTDLTIIDELGFIFFDISELRIWNCDIKELNTKVSGTILDQLNVPIENRLIQFNFTSGGQEFVCSGGNTNSLGQFETRVPRNIALTLNIYDQNCKDIFYTQEIGPFGDENDPLDIIAQINKESYTITGLAFDCEGNITFNNATVFLYDLDGNVRVSTQTNEDGSFTIHNICFDTTLEGAYRIGVLNLDSGDYILTDQLPFAEVDTDIGNVFPCDDPQEYISVVSVFGDLFFDDPRAFYELDSLIIVADTNNISFSLVASVSEEGINPVSSIEVVYSPDQTLRCTSEFQHTNCDEAVTLTITDINSNTQIISGNIEGTLFYGEISQPGLTESSDVFIDFRVKYE